MIIYDGTYRLESDSHIDVIKPFIPDFDEF
jgi:hypothetical protein